MTDQTFPLSWTVSRRNVPTFLSVLLALLVANPAKPQPTTLRPDDNINPVQKAKTPLAAATLVFMGGTPATAALTELALLQSGDVNDCWTLVNADRARPLPPLLLAYFSNRLPLKPLPTLTDNPLEYQALSTVLLLASKNTPAAFHASANPRITYAEMFQRPDAQRGQVVHVEGDAQLVNKLDAPAGIEHLYEVWIVNKAAGPAPYSVLLTELPPDLPVGKRIDIPVALDGYFLRRRHEKREDAVPVEAWRDSLLIAGRSLTVQKLLALMVTAEGRRTVGAATLFLNGASLPSLAPLTEVTLLNHGDRAGCWKLVNSDIVRPIPPETLANIKDGKTLPARSTEGLEFDALIEVLTQTWYTSPGAFEKAARKDLSFTQLFQNPEQYRGEVVHLEGRLRLLQRWDPPLMAREAGVPAMYEAAIFDDASGSNPYLVFVMDRPDKIPLNEKVNETVAVDGYFYKKWRYKSLDSFKPNEFRDAPLLIGRSLKVRKAPPGTGTTEELPAWAMYAAAGVVGVLTVGVVLMFLLAFWLRRGDAQAQERLHAVRTSTFVPPTPDDKPPLARPVHPPHPGRRHPSEPEA
jgi:hypothetical protein